MPTRTRRPAAKTPSKSRTAKRTSSRATPRRAAEPAVIDAPPPAAAAPAPAPAPKAGKQKPVRDSFTMPPADHALIAQIKQRALALRHPAKKSEVLRAGLKALAAMGDAALQAVLQAVPPLKTGRPKNAEAAPETRPAKAAKPGKAAKAEKASKAAAPAKSEKPAKPAKPAKPR
jgi:hypothetical protein